MTCAIANECQCVKILYAEGGRGGGCNLKPQSSISVTMKKCISEEGY